MKKTEYISVDGKSVNIEEMPKFIRDNVDLFDEMNGKLEAINLEQSIILIAAQSLQQKILNDIREHFKTINDTDNGEQKGND